ncbi:interleukin-12 subunit beta [Brachionichthys hirsutus]|uniref:interleukin-12 subunit beta n=1 Tax=Brachionichthys hirsutus TaxID=412623 RepID=UPI003604A47B
MVAQRIVPLPHSKEVCFRSVWDAHNHLDCHDWTAALELHFLLSSLQCNFIQMKTSTPWLLGALLVTLTRAHGLHQFPRNFVVANRNHPATLTCNTTTQEAVTWMFQSGITEKKNVILDKYSIQDGTNLIMSDLGRPMLGNYSCWKGAELLSSVYLFLEAEEETESDSPIHCRARSYDCNFTCTWNNSGYAAVRLGLGHNCSEHGKSCRWISSSKQLSDGGFQFEVSHSLSPYAEESTVFTVTAEAIKNNFIRRRTERFYLRDIIQPDAPQIVKCQEMEQKLNVSIEPPSTWSTPHSFFILEHQIEYVRRDDGQVRRSLSALIPKRISQLRVRSRDSLVLSNWSHWTSWMEVIF